MISPSSPGPGTPPSSFRRWQEFALRSAAGGLLAETWSEFFFNAAFAATNSRLVYFAEDQREDDPLPGTPLSWITWTQVLVAHVLQRGPPQWVLRHLPPPPEQVCATLPYVSTFDFRRYCTLIRPVSVTNLDGGERLAGRTVSLSQGIWWATI